jgi:general secretion pathway protein C
MRKLYSTLFDLVALSVVIYIGVDTFYKVVCSHLTQIEIQETGVHKRAPIQLHKGESFSDFSVITDRNIFGALEKPIEKAKADYQEKEEIEALEPTSLGVSLLGTVAGSRQNSCAVIQEKQKKDQALYKNGDTIQNAVIMRILRGKVVLKVGDRDEILTMEEAATEKTKRGETSKDPAKAGSTLTLNRSDLENSLADLGKLLTQVRVRPHIRNGKPEGLEVAHIKTGSIFAKLGLENGDIVQKINGSPIKSPDDVFSLYQRLKSGSRVSVELERKGEMKTIDYNFK